MSRVIQVGRVEDIEEIGGVIGLDVIAPLKSNGGDSQGPLEEELPHKCCEGVLEEV